MENISIGCYIILIWSLIESLTLLPAHLAHSSDEESKFSYLRKLSRNWEKIQTKIVDGLTMLSKITTSRFLRRH